MADVASTLPAWSTTGSSNNPVDATTVGAGLADNLGEIQAVVRAWLATKGSDIAAATTTDLGAVAGLFHDITGGSVSITGLGTISAGIWKVVKFEGANTLTHNATSLILPGGANITTANGDMAMFTSEGSGNWRCNWYVPASAAGHVFNLTDPNADRILFWDDSAGANQHLSLSGLTITTTTLAVDAASDTAAGKVELATTAEVQTGTDTARAVTPAGMQNGKIVLGTEQASTSGTAITFSSIPSWAKRITIHFIGVSTNGTDAWLIQLGDAGGLEATGYLSAGTRMSAGVATTGSTAGFLINTSAATDVVSGTVVLSLEDASDFTWTCMGVLADQAVPNTFVVAGRKATSAALDRVAITTTGGTNTFDAGAINITYE